MANGTGSIAFAREVLIPFLFDAPAVSRDNPADFANLILPEAKAVNQRDHVIKPEFCSPAAAPNVNMPGLGAIAAEEEVATPSFAKNRWHF